MLRRVVTAVVLVSAVLIGACSAAKTVGGSSGSSSEDGTTAGSGGAGTTSNSGAGGLASVSVGQGGATSSTTTSSSVSSGAGGSSPSKCDACAMAGGMCVNDVCTIVENPGKIDAGTQAQLESGGAGDAAFKWLYPYDKTVFARGLLSPTLQFAGVAPNATLLRVTFPGFDYKGFYGASNPMRVKPSQAVWDALTLAAGATTVVKVDVTKVAGGKVAGPITETWKVAPGSLRGAIYYETYGSPLAGGPLSVGIMKINPGAAQPVVMQSGCGNVCHTASADGSTLVAASGFFGLNSSSYDLKKGGAVVKTQGDMSFVYGGLTPDGSLVMSATNYRTWTGLPSRLYDSKTGIIIPTPSWDGVVQKAAMPSFAPDGSAIVFNRVDTGGGHSLATMTFAKASKTFSALTDLTNNATRFLGWPAFTPDAKWVVYDAGTNSAFETNAGALGDLHMVNVATKKSTRLDLLDGYSAAKNYLPANDPELNFAPTVLPVAVGGYFWVVFTSHRSYGNTLPSKDNNGQNGKLWVAALDINATDGIDASHPAFFLDGQELPANNLRGFWVLNPCKQDGEACKGGDECCGGFCYEYNGKIECRPVSNGCAKELEKCTTNKDCCDPGSECINGHCALPNPK
jgi:hypothetical protein